MRTPIHILMTLLMLVMPVIAKAQFGFDVGSVEAYISDHKNQRSLLLARATLEQSNNLLHEYSAKAAEDYKVLNFDLDKYTRAFDVIDVLYQSLRTSMNVYSTYQTVSDRIGDYKKLLSDYNSKVLKRNKLALQDTIIIRISLRCIDRISAEGKSLYRSVSDLVLLPELPPVRLRISCLCWRISTPVLTTSRNCSMPPISIHGGISKCG